MKPGKQPLVLFRVNHSRGATALMLAIRVILAMGLSFVLEPPRLFGEAPSKPLAPEIYDQAVQLRTALEGKPKRLRSSNEYQKVIDKYRLVYHQFPASSKADDALLAVAELYQLMGS